MLLRGAIVLVLFSSVVGVEKCTPVQGQHFAADVPTYRSVNGLTLCKKFEKKTCCARTETDALFR